MDLRHIRGKHLMNWRIFFSFVAVVSLFAYALHRWLHVNFWFLLGLIIVSLFLNSMLAEWEDRRSAYLLDADLTYTARRWVGETAS